VQAQTPRPLQPSDIHRVLNVRDPQVSPDGEWIAYTLTRTDSVRDRSVTDVWMVNWAGTERVRLTSSPDSENTPRWSPDGRHLAFLSSRQEGDGAQVWLLDRRGGEAERVTSVKGGVRSFAWSPDSRRLALVIEQDTDTLRADTARNGRALPIVVDRYRFKVDVRGYLGTERTNLALFDLGTRKVDSLTWTLHDDDSPAWSPDGSRIAFVRTVESEPGVPANSDIWVMEARRGATPRRLTEFPGPDAGPLSWSPDGRWIAFRQGDEPQYFLYQQYRVAVVPADGSAAPRFVSPSLDLPMASPEWSVDGAHIFTIVQDDRARNLARLRVSDGAVEWPLRGRHVVDAFSQSPGGRLAVLLAEADRLGEIHALDGATPRRLTVHTDSFFQLVRIVQARDFTSRSPDGTVVNGLYFPPLDAPQGSRPPLVAWIHGGPHAQDEFAFHFDRQLLAAHGYGVLAVNYRGSSGRGFEHGKALFADWGNREVVDMEAAMDEAVRLGLADPDRLGVGGWSYGGILTNYLIASNQRYRAAFSGAGASLFMSLFGVDQYVDQYAPELGYPWENPDLYMRISYPFFRAPQIKTPTLFMVGERDHNVPAAGSEQMYMALRSVGTPTQLIIYPGQPHGIGVPSYRVDRMTRVLDWYARYLR
jgi:dipeptidyl aminopeptidase/acylaminoacyl peptidase